MGGKGRRKQGDIERGHHNFSGVCIKREGILCRDRDGERLSEWTRGRTAGGEVRGAYEGRKRAAGLKNEVSSLFPLSPSSFPSDKSGKRERKPGVGLFLFEKSCWAVRTARTNGRWLSEGFS